MKGKFTQVSDGGVVTREDFIGVLETWMEFYGYAYTGGKINEKVCSGLMRVASSLYVIDSLLNTPAAYRINRAKAAATDGSSIDEVKAFISEALLIMTQ